MSIHKLTAGSGYDYLTRQVAALDATDKGHVGLADYYTEKGETPGVWVGSGMAGIDGLAAGDVVTADQMQALFGSGHHPLANQRTAELDQRVGRPGTASPTAADYRTGTRLGTPYKVYENDVSAFRIDAARGIEALNQAAGLPTDWPVPAAEQAKVRTQVAREFFTTEHGREPADARELAAVIAKHSRPKTNAVAGFDLTFSPVKSVSTLWAVADPKTAAVIEQAHQAAIKDALDFIEHRALFTRMGTNGVRQVNVRGLVATAFTHRDSRAGDPDLHTHVAVANKVQTLSVDGTGNGDGKWRAIDGRVLFKATVAASETYNTALERHLVDALGVRFAERPGPPLGRDARKRPVREIVGVEADLNHRFSKRRTSIEDRRKILAAQFQASHGRPPTPVETLQLAQQATLETREAKHEPRSLAEQREAWHTEAVEVLGGGLNGAQRLKQMVHGVLKPTAAAPALADSSPDSRWFAGAADRVVSAMEAGRASWQYWHVYAEAQRQVRAGMGWGHVPTDQVPTVVDLLVSEVLDARSVSLARPCDPISEPAELPELRRVDGASVYTVAGADLFTSAKVITAEQRLVAAAGRRDGYTVASSCVDLALLESAANGVTLNAGQITLVRELATSGARLQLAIAPAGSGKTTAMRSLADAWAEGGGTVIGLAPSAAAADALGQSMGQAMGDPTQAQGTTQGGNRAATRTDTLAKLTHSLITGDTPANIPNWVADIGPSTLVVIDEAGMADTLSLDAAVAYVLDQGGSVRLVGDDQQLAAIGAGGVLRDIRAEHGALRLTELVRFTDPAEGAASLAMREGKPEALGFYLDRGRVHVGDLATMSEDVFSAWQADRAAGLDSIMLAPTRDLVSELNQLARAHRLDVADPGVDGGNVGPVVRLSDGNEASVGDLITTRSNDRRLRASATDWVKNGDRWHLLEVHRNGDLSVQHAQHGRTVRLPAEYVQASTELGYACTVHTAQGVTSDSMHGLATGTESRQQLYTMLTRGRVANHVYLEIVGDGDPHSVIHPDMVQPLTATDILSSMLARDDAQRSTTSLLRDQASPGVRLGEATQRYLDGLYVAAEHFLRTRPGAAGVDVVDALDTAVDQLVPGLCDDAAWPTLRAHLLLLGAHGQDPVDALRDAAGDGELASAADRAAVLDWRLDASGLRNAGAGPLPWVPAIPDRLVQDERWGEYLTQRAQLVTDLAGEVRHRAAEAAASGTSPVWAQNAMRPDETTVANVEVWRAAMQVAADDRRPTGAPQLQQAAGSWQRRLNRRIAGDHAPALKEWSHLLHQLAPQIHASQGRDQFIPMLAERLAAMSRAGIAAHQLVATATATGPLPDEHAAAALWWRIARHLTPAVAAQIGDTAGSWEQVTTDWTPRLAELLSPERGQRIQASTWWPALVANVDHGLQRGWRLEVLLPDIATADAGGVGELDECQALVWRTSIALDPIPDEHADVEHEQPPEDLWDGYQPPTDVMSADVAPGHHPHVDRPAVDRGDAELTLAALIRDADRRAGVLLEPTGADVRRMYQRAEEWDHCLVSKERMVEVNQLAQVFFESRFARSWGQDYLAERFGMDLAGDDRFRPGHAPAGWTNLVDHLRRHGVTDEEMVATGVATTARTGRLIDRFRDRVVFPVVHPERPNEVLGFVGRRHPTLTDVHQREDNRTGWAGPKYLNTADTPLFHKGAQLFGAHLFATHSPAGDPRPPVGTPVLVEGPMDAIAVTLASAGRFIGVAPLGTSLTDEQAAQLAAISHQTGQDPVVATDADLAGQLAAQRDFWMLTPHGLDPTHAHFPAGHDPADLLMRRGPAALAGALVGAHPLGDALLLERLQNLDPAHAKQAALQVLAVRPGGAWDPGLEQVAAHLKISREQLRRELHTTIKTWNNDPRATAGRQLQNSNDVRTRLKAAAAEPPADRWRHLATELDPRLASQTDWAATAGTLQQGHDEGHDVAAAARDLVTERPLGDQPARDLRYRLVSRLDMNIDTGEGTYGQGAPVARERPNQGNGRAEEHRRDPNSSPSHGRPRR